MRREWVVGDGGWLWKLCDNVRRHVTLLRSPVGGNKVVKRAEKVKPWVQLSG